MWLDGLIERRYGERPNYLVVFAQPIGLLLLLAAFLWQTEEEYLNSFAEETYKIEINEKLLYLWMAEYDDALADGRVQKNDSVISMNFINYDDIRSRFKTWGDIKNELEDVDKQYSYASTIRFFLYIVGSIFVLLDSFIKAWKDRNANHITS